MILVVSCSDLFFTMLGWDGLGLISFFLIVFYQNRTRVTSGLFTVIINRLGDSLFILALVLLSASFPVFRFLRYHLFRLLLVFTLVLCFITKSAIFPFSSWLPAAIAAPTPISALVHSSTLVTSGLFLIIRYSYFFYCCPTLLCLLLVLTIFTSFYAGLNSLFEVDMKKLIALSTLRHLGFIGLAFSLGFIGLAFLHILVHALFKSLLFMCMGDIMHCSFHSQDARYLRGGISIAPFSSQVMQVCLANLLGMPLVSGFFSKDLVLETIGYSHLGYILAFVVYLNVGFTHFYTYKLFLYTLTPNSIIRFRFVHPVSSVH
jgi:NADH-ubiquinone oxidoreductase chain 5